MMCVWIEKAAEALERLVATLQENERSLVLGEGIIGIASRIRSLTGLRYIIYSELEKIDKARTSVIQVRSDRITLYFLNSTLSFPKYMLYILFLSMFISQ
jgi:hypothetical protein